METRNQRLAAAFGKLALACEVIQFVLLEPDFATAPVVPAEPAMAPPRCCSIRAPPPSFAPTPEALPLPIPPENYRTPEREAKLIRLMHDGAMANEMWRRLEAMDGPAIPHVSAINNWRVDVRKRLSAERYKKALAASDAPSGPSGPSAPEIETMAASQKTPVRVMMLRRLWNENTLSKAEIAAQLNELPGARIPEANITAYITSWGIATSAAEAKRPVHVTPCADPGGNVTRPLAKGKDRR